MKRKHADSNWLTANRLAAKTHAEHRHVTKWMAIEGVPSKEVDGHTVYERSKALAAIEAHQKPEVGTAQGATDPETGLPWSAAKLREDVLQSRATRDRDKLLRGGELVPVGVIEQAAEQVGYAFNKLANDAYVNGMALDEAGRAVIERLGQRAKGDFRTWIQQTLARASELSAQQSPPAEEVECPPGCWPAHSVTAMCRSIVNRFEQLPGRAKSELALTQPQAGKLQALLEDVRGEIASDIEALKPAEQKGVA